MMTPLHPDLSQPAGWLPLAFLIVMGLAMLAYVILDGYDLGVGILMRYAEDAEKDMMIASIGPFWDANETWLVLGVGILLVAFPTAHGQILGALYLPVALMLLGLILRGVAFDFRVKAQAQNKPAWNLAFHLGSILAAFSQGFMLGMLVLGFNTSLWSYAFAALIGVSLMAAYCLLGATWLLMKSEGQLQIKAATWARHSLWLAGIGIATISIVTPFASPSIAEKWFSFPNFILLFPIPLITAILFWWVDRVLKRLPKQLTQGNQSWIWTPFASTVGIFLLAFHGLAYSLFPYLIIDKITIWQAASAPESLMIIFVGACIVLPVIIGYTVMAYRIFWGKATLLEY
jgi:cytochrome d ubiquinol oxidase subunit II